jgi:hypothetical protein
LKLWLLDADVIIKLLELDAFDRLVAKHEVHVASTVVDEVKYYRREGQVRVDFRVVYVLPGRVTEASATAEQMQGHRQAPRPEATGDSCRRAGIACRFAIYAPLLRNMANYVCLIFTKNIDTNVPTTKTSSKPSVEGRSVIQRLFCLST